MTSEVHHIKKEAPPSHIRVVKLGIETSHLHPLWLETTPIQEICLKVICEKCVCLLPRFSRKVKRGWHLAGNEVQDMQQCSVLLSKCGLEKDPKTTNSMHGGRAMECGKGF